MMAALLWLIGIVPIVVVPFGPRSFDDFGKELAYIQESAIMVWVARLGTALIFGSTAASLFWALYKGRLRIVSWSAVPMLLLVLAVIPSMLFSIQPSFSFTHITYLLALATIASLVRSDDMFSLLSIGKAISLIYVWGSLLVALLVPQWALETNYEQGYLPLLGIRLHGLAIHANQLAVFAWLYLVLEMTLPSTRGSLRGLHLAAAFAVLLLSQSKTAWLLCLWSFAVWLAMHQPRRFLLLLSGAVAGILAFFFSLLVLGKSPATFLKDIIDRLPEEFYTLTGRTFIWQVTLLILEENPWFGYGPNLWSPEMAIQYVPLLGWVVLQSHNQYLQSLGEGGIWGLLMFLLYAAWVTALAFLSRRYASGIGFILFSSLLMRGLTESWFRRATVDGHLFFHAFILAVVFAGYEGWVASRTSFQSTQSGVPFQGSKRGKGV